MYVYVFECPARICAPARNLCHHGSSVGGEMKHDVRLWMDDLLVYLLAHGREIVRFAFLPRKKEKSEKERVRRP